MFMLADVKKLAQNMGVSYSGFMKPAKSNTCKLYPNMKEKFESTNNLNSFNGKEWSVKEQNFKPL